LKAALAVLGKHHEAPPESTVEGGAIFKSQRDSWSLMQRGSSDRFPSKTMRSFDRFMSDNGIGEDSAVVDSETSEAVPVGRQKFLQQAAANDAKHGWSDEDAALVKLAVKSASAFVQSKQGMGYYPAYFSRSGEIMGVLKQLKEEMEGDLSEAQKTEQERAASFAALRAAKTDEIRSGEQRAERRKTSSLTRTTSLPRPRRILAWRRPLSRRIRSS